MDYNIARIQENIKLEEFDGNKYGVAQARRMTCEYALAFVLAYLWDKRIPTLKDTAHEVVVEMNKLIVKPSIGTLVGICRELADGTGLFTNSFFGEKKWGAFVKDRNTYFGHGWITQDNVDIVTKNLKETTGKLFESGFLAQDFDLVYVNRTDDINAFGVRYTDKKDRTTWLAPLSLREFKEGHTYATANGNEYWPTSPFIIADRRGNFSVYKNIEEPLTCRTSYNPIPPGTPSQRTWADFLGDVASDGVRRKTSNGTVTNVYRPNYNDHQYVKNPKAFSALTGSLRRFVKQSANVCLAVVGHGGVGKTAVVQHFCEELCRDDRHRLFDYIVFVSAKAVVYNYILGKTEEVKVVEGKRIETFNDVLECINTTMGYQELHQPSQVYEYGGHVLVVIDDYETFDIKNQEQIANFIRNLDASRHKVIVTTRQRNTQTTLPGDVKPAGELNENDTKDFLEATLINQNSPIQFNEQQNTRIYKITAGRPIFILQFVFLALRTDPLKLLETADFANRREAIDFLYGNIYGCLDPKTKIVFCAIGALVRESDGLVGVLGTLRTIVDMEDDSEEFDDRVAVLEELRVVEKKGTDMFRVYSS